MENIVSAVRLKPKGLHLGHYLGNFATRKSAGINYSMPYLFVIEDLFPSTNFKTDKLNRNSITLIEDLYTSALMNNYDLKIVFLSDIVSYKSVINSLLLEFINVNHLRGIHPKRTYLRNSFDNIQLSEFMFIVFEAYYILALNAKYVFMNDDNLPFVNYSRKLARRINNTYGTIFTLPHLETGIYPRLKGTDGERMSKSRENEIYLNDSQESLIKKLDIMFSTSKCTKTYIRVDENGFYRHKTNPISENYIPFQYLDIFCETKAGFIKNEFTSGTISLTDLRVTIENALKIFLDKFRKEKKSNKWNLSLLKHKLSEDLNYVRGILQNTESKILEVIK